jgi:hypothetical protein
MATSSVTTPTPAVPITGAVEPFNTTGYPVPNQPIPMKLVEPGEPMPDFLTIYPSQESIEFSIGDLRHLGKFEYIGHLVVEVRLVDPRKAELREFKIQITSPERRVLHTIKLQADCDNIKEPESKYVFFLSEHDAREAQKDFVQGNRLIVHAKSAVKIVKGVIQLAVRECR